MYLQSIYELIIICQTLASGNVCLFQISGKWEENEVYPVIWVSRPLTGGVSDDSETAIIFSWNTELSVACKSTIKHSGMKTLSVVTDSVFITSAADPKDRKKKAFLLSYKENAYQFRRDDTDVDDQTSIILKTGWNIPGFPQAEAGLCMDECFIGMVRLGPNLTYKIDAETEYGLLFGRYRQGDRINPADIKNSPRFSLKDFDEHNEKTVVLQRDNTFLFVENGLNPDE